MKIITISREFGSGGRELGKRLADVLGFAYYDREIITAIAEKQGLDENYVEKALERGALPNFPLSYRNSFVTLGATFSAHTDLLLEQKRVLESIAKLGQDCVIVGRNADVLLEEYQPFNVFVCGTYRYAPLLRWGKGSEFHSPFQALRAKWERLPRRCRQQRSADRFPKVFLRFLPR